MNENVGRSNYNSMQLKLEKRFSQGVYGLVSYTLSKLKESADPNTQRGASGGLSAVISPFNGTGKYTISQSDTPHVSRRRSCTSCLSVRASDS